MATSAASTYDQLRAEHEWRVPEHYNIVQDVCDKHPRDKPAMIWERFDGARRDLAWGELQDLANQAAHVLRELFERVAVAGIRERRVEREARLHLSDRLIRPAPAMQDETQI